MGHCWGSYTAAGRDGWRLGPRRPQRAARLSQPLLLDLLQVAALLERHHRQMLSGAELAQVDGPRPSAQARLVLRLEPLDVLAVPLRQFKRGEPRGGNVLPHSRQIRGALLQQLVEDQVLLALEDVARLRVGVARVAHLSWQSGSSKA